MFVHAFYAALITAVNDTKNKQKRD